METENGNSLVYALRRECSILAVQGRLLEAWVALTVGEEVSKLIGSHGISYWLALTLLLAKIPFTW